MRTSPELAASEPTWAVTGDGVSGPEAGWYPDESDPDRARFWDGSIWTERTRPRAELIPSVEEGDADEHDVVLPPEPDAPTADQRLADAPVRPVPVEWQPVRGGLTVVER